MDEKTAELRDLFVETTGEETVTESQSTPRGTMGSDRDDEAVDDRVTELIETMRERYEFASPLATPDLRRVVRAFFDPDAGAADAESWSAEADSALADSLAADVDGGDVFRARMDLHLVGDADRDGPVPYDRLRRRVLESAEDGFGPVRTDLDDDALAAELAAAVDEETAAALDPEAVRRARLVVEAELASRQVNHRFRDAFTDLLTDADLSTRLATDARRDGLKEATEDIETDVSL
ncbi:conditioned medium-induced protein 4 [Halobellus rarus]|uniref:Conditioned medium-induced protein 4 n=1 Tax=Halobellus rarus TaxID=1126237 RepID=A0ABD6CNE3_9EURY|nr:conditioned medium-induced protein 4 [Halobellus rarus]